MSRAIAAVLSRKAWKPVRPWKGYKAALVQLPWASGDIMGIISCNSVLGVLATSISNEKFLRKKIK